MKQLHYHKAFGKTKDMLTKIIAILVVSILTFEITIIKHTNKDCESSYCIQETGIYVSLGIKMSWPQIFSDHKTFGFGCLGIRLLRDSATQGFGCLGIRLLRDSVA